MACRRHAAASGAALVLLLLVPAAVAAQAWPAPTGAGAVTVSTQVIENTAHQMTDGFRFNEGKSRNVSMLVEADYAVTDRLSVSLGLPYVFSRFIGPGDPPVVLPVDTCRCWHGAWQDVNATARYAVADGALALTPSVSVGVPSHAYAYEGEAVAGFGLKELRLAVDGGLRLDALTSRVALIGRYQYAIVEDVLDVPNNRSNWSVGASVAATTRLAVRVSAQWQHTHGGLRFGSVSGVPFPPFGEFDTPELIRQHDRLLRDNNWRIGAGLSYALPAVDVFVSYLHFMGGTDTHLGRAVTTGISVPFRWRG